MSRDKVYSVKTFDVNTEVVDHLTDQTTVETSKSYLLSRAAERADAISTARENGGYFRPTPYWAYRYGIDQTSNVVETEELWAVFNACNSNVSVHKTTSISGDSPPKTLGVLHTMNRSGHPFTGGYTYRPKIPGYLESRALRNLQRLVQQQGWEVSQTAGEMPETVGLLLSASKRLLTSVKYLKQGRPLKALINLGIDEKRAKKSIIGNSANLMLEFQYGWKPLMTEIHSLADAIENGLNQPISKPITVVKEEVFSLNDSFIEDYCQWTHTGGGKYVVKTGIKAFVDNDTLAQLGSHGLLNPAALAWELFPMSFVIDWFVPIGSFISGLSTSFGMDFRDGYLTKYVEWERSTTGVSVPIVYQCINYPERQYHVTGGSVGERYGRDIAYTEWNEAFERQLMPFPPPPVPYWDPQLNKSKITSIMTLITAIIAK